MKFLSSFNLAAVFFLFFAVGCNSDDATYVEYSEEIIRELPKNSATEPAVFQFTAGSYENALIAAEGNKISGLYNPGTKSCSFFFEGTLSARNTEFLIKWTVPGTEKSGEGSISADATHLILKINNNKLSGCSDELLKTGLRINLEKASNWKSIRMLNTKSISIFSEPEEGMEIGQNFKKGDILCVLESKGDWIRCENIGTNTKAGWIKASDLEQ